MGADGTLTQATQRLPDILAIFAAAFAETGDAAAAALQAGVHEHRARRFAADALRRPDVRAAVHEYTQARFIEAGPIALNNILKMAKNVGNVYKPDIQLAASKTLLDRAGYTTKDMRDASDKPAKDLAELSRDELLAALKSTEDELANRAQLVELSPKVDAIPVQVLDLEG